jgi:hypothetical protein
MAVENWFIELIRDKTRLRYSQQGGYLDDTMTRGDGHAGEIKFPVAGGTIQMYELTGAIQEIDASSINMDTVSLSIRDFEAASYFRQQDVRKMGPSQQDALAKLMARSVRVKRDTLKFDALNAFSGATSPLTDAPVTVETIGDGSAVIDLDTAVYIGDSIAGSGAEDDMYYPIPYAWFSQLMMYKQFSNSQYQGPTDQWWASSAKVRLKTFQGVHFMALPNAMFRFGTGAYGTGTGQNPFDPAGYLDTFAWAKDAVGSEIEWDQENMTIDPQPQLKGTPNLCKVQLSGNSLGILPEGVKRIRMKAINKAALATAGGG